MRSKDWIERMVAARLAEHDERVRLRRAGKAATGARWHAVVLARERATEERARLRELRNKPCGARTRAGHPCRRKGLGKGGRCPNHGGMSTGPRTPEGAPGSRLLSRHAGQLGGPLPLQLCGEAAKQSMLDAWEIRKRIAYAERRLRERLAETNAARRKAKRARRLRLRDGRQLCGAPTRNGSPCRRWAQPDGRCLTHG